MQTDLEQTLGNMWKISLINLGLILGLVSLLGTIYIAITQTTNKHPIGNFLNLVVCWLDKARPKDWLNFILEKSNRVRIFVAAALMIILYVSSIFFFPDKFTLLIQKGLINAPSVVLLFLVIFASLLICTRFLLPLIKERKYKRILSIEIIGVVFYWSTMLILRKNPKIISLIINKDLSILLDIIVFMSCVIYGFLLWVSIVSVFLLLLFLSISLLAYSLAWLIPRVSKAVRFIIKEYGTIIIWAPILCASAKYVVDVIVAKQ